MVLETRLYDILNINPNASQSEITKAYRKLAMKLHPDKNKAPDAKHKFQELSFAYNVLKDIEKRKKYDTLGENSLHTNNNTDFDPFRMFNTIFNINEGLHNTFFERFNILPNRQKIKSIIINLNIDLLDFYTGSQKDIIYVKDIIEDINGKRIIKKMNSKINIHIKKGMKHGQKIILKNKGHQYINKNIIGDVIINILEKKHNRFKRDNKGNLITKFDIPLIDALTGINTIIEHLDKRKLSIQYDYIIKPRDIKVIQNEGMPLQHNPSLHGHLIIKFNVIFPEELSEKQKKYLNIILKKNDNNDNDNDDDDITHVFLNDLENVNINHYRNDDVTMSDHGRFKQVDCAQQ